MKQPTLAGFVFQQPGAHHALEDRYLCNWEARAVAIADGVTRAEYGADASQQSERVGEVAMEFCSAAMDQLILAGTGSTQFGEAMQRAGTEANRRIASINARYGFHSKRDYLSRDPYAAVGCCGVLDADHVWHFGYLGDCEIRLLGADGRNVALSEDQLIATRRVLKPVEGQLKKEWRALWRALRNRAEATDADAKPCGYGVFNGDPRAEAWWRHGSVAVQTGDILVLSTDGGIPLVRDSRFSDRVRCRLNAGGVDLAADCRELFAIMSAAKPSDFVDDATVIVARVC